MSLRSAGIGEVTVQADGFPRWRFAMALSISIVVALFFWEGLRGFNLWDEGFLWYGVKRVLAGEVPIRDFMAYDPGRYYWSAIFVGLAPGYEMLALRLSLAVFQALGLWVGLTQILACCGRRGYWFPAAVAICLSAWMFPRHKLFDVTLSILLIGVLAFLARRPSPRRFFRTGIAIGLVAVFGRNHAIYGIMAGLILTGYLYAGRGVMIEMVRMGGYTLAGVVLGYVPVLVMLIWVPGFSTEFWSGVRFLAENKATNLPLSVPWPWTVNAAEILHVDGARTIVTGLFFLGLLVFGVAGLGYLMGKGLRSISCTPTFMAAVCLGLPYAHFAFSRADVGHLAQAIFPLLIGTFAILASAGVVLRLAGTLVLLVASVFVVAPFHPGWMSRTQSGWTTQDVGGANVLMDPGVAADVTLVRRLTRDFAPGSTQFLVTPLWPGAYALMGRRSPTWEIYALFPRSELFQSRELERIKRADPGFVLIYDLALDGRDELRFTNTHGLIDRFIRDNYVPMTGYSNNPAFHLFRRRQVSP